MFYYEENKYRVETVQFSQSGANITAVAVAPIEEFNENWAGKTFSNFTNFAFDGEAQPDNFLSFNEFTVIPLAKVE
jgi:hypothetical protein